MSESNSRVNTTDDGLHVRFKWQRGNARHTGAIPRGPKISLSIHPETLDDSSSNPTSLAQHTRQLESAGSGFGLRTGGDNRGTKEESVSLKKCHISHRSNFLIYFRSWGYLMMGFSCDKAKVKMALLIIN
jgi:hypothetical protein